MSVELSVIICTYNRAGLLAGALKTLGDQDLDPGRYEIVVVDDGSTDATASVGASLVLPCDLRMFTRPHGGRSAARNFGIAQARGSVILFVDDDILATGNLLSRHLADHEGRDRRVVRGPIVNVAEYAIPAGHETSMQGYSAAFFCTCNASVAKAAFDEVGVFDESFVEYGWEDNELGLRLRQAGYKVKFNMGARVFHYKPHIVGEDQLEEVRQKAREMGRTAVAFLRKHPTWRVRFATGIYPANMAWQALAANKLISEASERLLTACRVPPESGWHRFFTKRIFNYHYMHAIREALARR